MKIDEILFTVNEYDRDGDLIERGIFLHFGETRIKVAENADEFAAVVKRLGRMTEEIKSHIKKS